MKKLIPFILLALIILATIAMKGMNANTQAQIHLAITPHFMIKPKIVDERYAYLSQTTYKNFSPDAIIVISPNHFNRGAKPLESVDSSFDTLCYRENCSPIKSLSTDNIGNGYGNNGSSDSEDIIRPLSTEGRAEIIDHGIGEHLTHINKFFPKATVYPLLVDEYSAIAGTQLEGSLHKIVQELTNKHKKLLVIASVDFSHYVEEKFARLHDQTAIYTIQDPQSELADFMKIEADCPACLWGITSLGKSLGQKPVLRYRDSAATIAGDSVELKAQDNTSRQFWYFVSTGDTKSNTTSGLTIAFFGDLIYDRGVESMLPTEKALNRHFRYLFMLQDPTLPPESHGHRPLKGIDMVGFNNEMPITRTADEQSKDCVFGVKEPRFCGHDRVLNVLKKLGFNFATLANNHALRDMGLSGFQETVQAFEKHKIPAIGYVSSGNFARNMVWTGTTRGVKHARHGYDFTLTTGKLEEYCDILQSYKQQGFVNFVTVHRGLEYEKTHNASQEIIGKKLIDCGAEIIIGHHPHVVQDIERYKGKPIVYSLGNFLFDQNFSEETKHGNFVLIDRSSDKISLQTGSLPALPQ